MRQLTIPALLILAAGCSSTGTTSSTAASPSAGGYPGLNDITQADIRRDIFALGGDAMRGREAGTLDEMRATGWVQERAREAGLLPAGEDNTYFQWWSIRRRRLSENSRISIGPSTPRLWSDAA